MQVRYRGTLVPSNRVFEVRAIDLLADLKMIWSWWNASHVQGHWSIRTRLEPYRTAGLSYRPTDLAAYLTALSQSDQTLASIGCIDGVDIGYIETYRIGSSPLASHPELAPDDRGFHALIGDTNYTGSGLGPQMASQLVRWQFGQYPQALRVILEPNITNAPAIKAATKVSEARLAGQVEFSHKTAELIIFDRPPAI